MRKTKFQTNEYYHIYNRGVDKREIFVKGKDYIRFLRGMRDFNDKDTKCPAGHLVSGVVPGANRLVDIICYCLNPNHYHFILRQSMEMGISKFLHKIEMGYAKYFNYRYDRSGALFQGTFKDVHIKSESYLGWLSGYVNGNSEIHGIFLAKDWPWSSYKDYVGLRKGTICDKDIIFGFFKEFEERRTYKEFVDLVIKEASQRKKALKEEFKKCLLE
ncbi:transposase [Patescibacteria group bacterium]|nr:transposase [Patescibacteria group bacterium]MCG2690735.1 transposase [Candidatus Parcubacteria bacterium]